MTAEESYIIYDMDVLKFLRIKTKLKYCNDSMFSNDSMSMDNLPLAYPYHAFKFAA